MDAPIEQPGSPVDSIEIKIRDGAIVGLIIGLYAVILYLARGWRLVFSEWGYVWIYFFDQLIPQIAAGVMSGLVAFGFAKRKQKVAGGAFRGAVGGAVGGGIGAALVMIFRGVYLFIMGYYGTPFWVTAIVVILVSILIGMIAGLIAGSLIAWAGLKIGGGLSVLLLGFVVILSISMRSAIWFYSFPFIGLFLAFIILHFLKKEEAAQQGALGAAVGGICGVIIGVLAAMTIVAILFTS